jgi:hypothetical protein
VPKVYWQYSTPEVLVLEYTPGTKINDGPRLDEQGLDRQRLARLAVESYLQQILRHGLFHVSRGWFFWFFFGGGGGVARAGVALLGRPAPPTDRPSAPPSPAPQADPHPGNVAVDPQGRLI